MTVRYRVASCPIVMLLIGDARGQLLLPELGLLAAARLGARLAQLIAQLEEFLEFLEID